MRLSEARNLVSDSAPCLWNEVQVTVIWPRIHRTRDDGMKDQAKPIRAIPRVRITSYTPCSTELMASTTFDILSGSQEDIADIEAWNASLDCLRSYGRATYVP